MAVKMNISAMAVDSATNMPIVLLKNEQTNQTLPIWIGLLEASAIATELEGIAMARPMTHDLMKHMLEALDAEVIKVVITDIRENTYYARLHINVGGKELELDARPSDSIALALRTKAPVFVEEKVLENTTPVEFSEEVDLSDEEKLKEMLETMDADEFGKYKM